MSDVGVTFRNVPNYQLKIRDLVQSQQKTYMPGVVPTVDVSFDYDDTAQYFGSLQNTRLNLLNPALHPEILALLPSYCDGYFTGGVKGVGVWSIDPDFPMMFRFVYNSLTSRLLFWTVTNEVTTDIVYGFSPVYVRGNWVSLGIDVQYGSGKTIPSVLPSSDWFNSSANILYKLFMELANNAGDWTKDSYCAKQYVLSKPSFVQVDKTCVICSFVKAGILLSGDLYNDSLATVKNSTVANSQLIIKSLNSSLLSDCDLKDLELSPGNYYLKSTDSFDKVVYLQKVD